MGPLHKSQYVTWFVMLLLVAFAVDWVLSYGSNSFEDIDRNGAGGGLLAAKSVIVLLLLLYGARRIGRYGTFERFVDTNAAKDPDSFYVLLKRDSDQRSAETVAIEQTQEDEFGKRVKKALG